MRPIVLSGMLFVLSAAFNLTTSKYGANVPDWIIIGCWLVPIAPLLWLAFTHPKFLEHRQWYVERFKDKTISTGILTIVAFTVLVCSLTIFCYRGWKALTKPTALTVPATAQEQHVDKPALQEQKPVTEIRPWPKSPRRSNGRSLTENALVLAANIRKLSQDWLTEKSKIDNSSDVTDEQRKQMLDAWSVKVMAEYDSKYKADARIIHDKLLAALPAGTDPLAMKDDYENEINPGLLEIVASNLEHLAKLLVDPKLQAKEQKTSPPRSIQQSNSGGVNVQQGTTGDNSPIIDSPITVGSIPKHISTQDQTSLVGMLSQARSLAEGVQIEISADQYSSPSPFPAEFYDVLKKAQWSMKEGEVEPFIQSHPSQKGLKGAIIRVRGSHDNNFVSDTDPVFYVGKALEKLKVPFVLDRSPGKPQGIITVQFEGGFPD